MDFSTQRKIAAKVLKVSPKRVRFVMDRKEDIKEAITREDVRGLIKDGAILKVNSAGISQGRTRAQRAQKRKGLQKGHGSRKGSQKAREGYKTPWVNRIRVLRAFLHELRDKEVLTHEIFKELTAKAKGGFFRNKRHVKVYIEERQLALKK